MRRHPQTYTWVLDNLLLDWSCGVCFVYGEMQREELLAKWMPQQVLKHLQSCASKYDNMQQDIVDNISEVHKPLWTAKGLEAKRNQGWSKEGLTKFAYECNKAVATNCVVINLSKVDVKYKENKCRLR
jgi:hypothetical protein